MRNIEGWCGCVVCALSETSRQHFRLHFVSHPHMTYEVLPQASLNASHVVSIHCSCIVCALYSHSIQYTVLIHCTSSVWTLRTWHQTHTACHGHSTTAQCVHYYHHLCSDSAVTEYIHNVRHFLNCEPRNAVYTLRHVAILISHRPRSTGALPMSTACVTKCWCRMFCHFCLSSATKCAKTVPFHNVRFRQNAKSTLNSRWHLLRTTTPYKMLLSLSFPESPGDSEELRFLR